MFDAYFEFDDYQDHGWHILYSTIAGYVHKLPHSASRDVQLEFIIWLLERHARKACESAHIRKIAELIQMAFDTEDLQMLQILVKLDPKGNCFESHWNSTLLHECFTLGYQSDVSNGHETVKLLTTLGYDLHKVSHGETPISEGLQFSFWFQEWRSWLGNTFLNDLIAELSCSTLPLSKKGWRLRNLQTLFELPERNSYPEMLQKWFSSFDMVCSICDESEPRWPYPRRPTRCKFLEPWWEELLERIRDSQCICRFIVDFQDSHAQTPGGTELKAPNAFDPKNACGFCRCKGRGDDDSTRDPLADILNRDQRVDEASIPREEAWEDRISWRTLSEKEDYRGLMLYHFHSQGGRWRKQYQPGMIYCCACLGRFEGWVTDEEEQRNAKVVRDDVESLVSSVPGAFVV
ncbi:MAG: hypothetical protein Q9157_003454 [Trypethelium eluteriae]